MSSSYQHRSKKLAAPQVGHEPNLVAATVQEMGTFTTDLGPALYIKIRRDDEAPMGWREVWEVFQDRYPGNWAVQVFPPADQLVDDANIYHLYVLESEPRGLNIWRG